MLREKSLSRIASNYDAQDLEAQTTMSDPPAIPQAPRTQRSLLLDEEKELNPTSADIHFQISSDSRKRNRLELGPYMQEVANDPAYVVRD